MLDAEHLEVGRADGHAAGAGLASVLHGSRGGVQGAQA